MKILVQRVSHASVEVESKVIASIDSGILAFVGVTHSDTLAEAIWLAQKLVHLRIFEDEKGKMNRSLLESHGKALIISQFTLYGDCTYGRRPSFTQAAPPDLANHLYEAFITEVRKKGVGVETGKFGAEMKVSLLNDGPVTLTLEKCRNQAMA